MFVLLCEALLDFVSRYPLLFLGVCYLVLSIFVRRLLWGTTNKASLPLLFDYNRWCKRDPFVLLHQGFEDAVKKTAHRVKRSSRSKIIDHHDFAPLPGKVPVELRETSITDKKTGEIIGGSIQQSELTLCFVYDSELGWSVQGNRHSKTGFYALSGFCNRCGEAYWVETASNAPSVLVLVNMNHGGFHGEWLSSENKRGSYVNCLFEGNKVEPTKRNDFSDLTLFGMIREVLAELGAICFQRRRHRMDESKTLMQIV